MPSGKYLQKIDLTHPKYLQTLVENRRVFNLQNCELNVFESYQQAWRVPLTFSDFVITSIYQLQRIAVCAWLKWKNHLKQCQPVLPR